MTEGEIYEKFDQSFVNSYQILHMFWVMCEQREIANSGCASIPVGSFGQQGSTVSRFSMTGQEKGNEDRAFGLEALFELLFVARQASRLPLVDTITTLEGTSSKASPRCPSGYLPSLACRS